MENERAVRLFADLFPPNPNRYGQMRDYDPETGKKKSVTVSEGVTLAMIAQHLNREGHQDRLGYLPGDDKATSVGIIDIDKKSMKDAFDRVVQETCLALSAANISYYKEVSTNGGVHIFIFCAERIPYEQMHFFLKAMLHESGHPYLETFPSSPTSGMTGKWLYMPYSGAAKDPKLLGTTWLTDRNGNDIPVTMLNNVVRNPAKSVILHAERYQEQLHYQVIEEADADTQQAQDLQEDAFEELRRAVMQPPRDGFIRHQSIIAFMNIAWRANRLGDMAELLASEQVMRAWTGGDGSRTLSEWEQEVAAWHKRFLDDANGVRTRHGVKFLLEQGWELGTLKRKPHSLLFEAADLNKVPEEELAEAIHSYLKDEGLYYAFDPDTVTMFHWDGTTWMPVLNGHEDTIKREVELRLLARGRGLRESRLTAVYKKLERLFLSKPLTSMVEPDFIACKNGVINWRTGELLPHSPDIITIGRAEASYRPELDATTGSWQEYLERAFAGQEHKEIFKTVLAEFLGYCLTREMRMRKMLNLHGPSSTGKTTAWRVALGVLGDASNGEHAAMGVSLEQSVFDAQDWGRHLVGPNLAVFDEMSTGDQRTGRKIINMLKVIAGNGAVNINPKGLRSTTARVSTKILFCTNYDLRLFEDSANDAVFRRIVRLPFENVITVDDERGRYEDLILDNDDERDKVLLWMLAGLRRLARQDWQLTSTPILDKQLDSSREDAEPLLRFVQECCETGPQDHEVYCVGAEQLRQEYIAWYGYEYGKPLKNPPNTKAFGQRMRRVVHQLHLQEAVTPVKKRMAEWQGLTVGNWRERYI